MVDQHRLCARDLARFVGLSIGMVLLVPLSAPAAAEVARPAFSSSTGEEALCRQSLAVAPGLLSDRKIATDDLAGLRDIGSVDDYQSGARPLSVSPDGKSVAFQMRRALPALNRYCTGLFLLSLEDSSRSLKLINAGGDLVRWSGEHFGMVDYPSGAPLIVQPRWSDDGSLIAFFRKDGSENRVWVVEASSGKAAPISPDDMAPKSFAWERGTLTLRISGTSSKTKTTPATDEGRRGYRYNERFWPVADSTPWPTVGEPVVTWLVKLERSRDRPTGFDAATSGILLDPRPQNSQPLSKPTIWLAPKRADLRASPSLIHIRRSGGETVCLYSACLGVLSILNREDDGSVIFLRLSGKSRSKFEIFRWNPLILAPPRLLLTTDSMISGCEPVKDNLICCLEDSNRPRRLVSISLDNSRIETLFDPNPEFLKFHLPAPQRVEWTNRFGIPSFGDLLVPSHSEGDPPPPLIVVQYESHGFLRGGTGDEYPIYALAARGFAVLSFNRPIDYGLFRNPDGFAAGNRLTRKDWNDRRSVQSSIEFIVDRLVRHHVVDPKRIAITGLSDGGSTASFALINSHIFSAAIFSTCCSDPTVQWAMMGPAYTDYIQESGFPRLDDTGRPWRSMAISQNAARVHVPILMQLADREFRMALPAYQALKSAGREVEMYVFPDEYHIKWQPAHRLAIYNRVCDWLEKWARGSLDIAHRQPNAQASRSAIRISRR